MLILKNFWKASGIVFVGLLAFFLLAFFVSVIFSLRGDPYVTRSVSSFGGGMMYGTSQVAGMPIMTADSLSLDSADVSQSVVGKDAGSMRESAPVPNMVATEKKTIKNGNLNLRVQNIDQTLSRVGSMVGDMGGNISDSHFNQMVSGIKSGVVTVKVPEDKFNEAFIQLKEMATIVLSESTSEADATAQYIDLQARINNEKAAEATLQALFERAVKISDVIEVTDKLAQTRGEIESLEGQLRYLSSRTDMASIMLSLTEDTTVVTDQGFRPAETLKESLVVLIRMLGDFIQGLIRFAVVGLPVFLVYGVIFWFIYRFVRRMVMRLWPGSLDEKRKITRNK